MFSIVKNHTNKIFIFLLLLFSILINQHYGNLGVFPIDTFLHFDSGYRILKGDHPFKDYWTVTAPAVDYIQAFFFYLFGLNWKSYVFHASLFNGFLTLATFFVLRKFKLNIYYSFFYSLLFSILAYPPSGTPFIDHHSAFFSLLAIYSLLLGIYNERKIYWILIPLFLGLAFLSKQVPSSYIILSIGFVLILYSFIKKKIDCLIYFSISSIIFILIILIFGKFQGIRLSVFFDQYIFYPQTIGQERYQDLNFSFRGVIGHFKFVYFAIIPLFLISIRNFFSNNNYIQNKDFYLFLILIFLTASFIFHQMLTKNQTFIFFLIPILTAFSHIKLNKSNLKYKDFLYFIIIFLCLFATLKYHLRFNENRKFHDLENINFQLSSDANKIDKKLSGLNWITYEFKNDPDEEIKMINQIQSYLRNDSRNKMLITNYSFFATILNEKTFSPSRVYAGDGTTNPIKGNKYVPKYKKLMIDLIKKNNISVIYITVPLDDSNIYDYIGKNCFEEINVPEGLKGYEIRDCDEI